MNKYKYLTLFLLFIVSLASILGSLHFGSIYSTSIISVFSILFLFITRKAWLPSDYGKNNVRIYSIASAVLVSTSSYWTAFLYKISLSNQYVVSIYEEIGINQSQITISIPVLVFLFCVILIVNLSMSKDTMGKHDDSFEKDIPEPEFKEKLGNALDALRDEIRSINKQSNWSGSHYTDTDAEVIIKYNSKKRKKTSSLIKALNTKQGRAFLVIGEPGSGKSVALRKLANDLIKQVRDAQKIPIYVNLKEWNDTSWSVENPPSEQQLYDFVKGNVADRDIELSTFVDEYFDRLYSSRRLFFIFDSFDEIPQVMSGKNDSLLIDQLSSVLFRFIKGNNNKPTGILASRKFKKPTNSFNASLEIEVRPFNGVKIESTVKKLTSKYKDFLSEFSKRRDLQYIAKNPFMLSMIVKYHSLHEKLPDNQIDIFSNFIKDSLKISYRKLEQLNIDSDEVIGTTKKIAKVLFDNNGLEASISTIKKSLPNERVDDVLECLKFARLIRSNSGNDGVISFVHRRFCEYFVVLDLLDKNIEIDFEHIPNDSLMRDSLVLYCEVSEQEVAVKIAKKCWSIILRDRDAMSFEAVHCMRFLRDAFKNRQDCILEFQKELEEFINEEIKSDKVVYWKKFVLELLFLSDEKIVEESVYTALKMNDQWIFDTAIESCRHLEKLDKDIDYEICLHINRKNDLDFIIKYSEYIHSFSISDSYSKVNKYLKLRKLDVILTVVTSVLLLIIEPMLFIALLLVITPQSMMMVLASRLSLPETNSKESKGNRKSSAFFDNLISKFFKSKKNKDDEVSSYPFHFKCTSFVDAFIYNLKFMKFIIIVSPLISIVFLPTLFFAGELPDLTFDMVELLDVEHYMLISLLVIASILNVNLMNVCFGIKKNIFDLSLIIGALVVMFILMLLCYLAFNYKVAFITILSLVYIPVILFSVPRVYKIAVRMNYFIRAYRTINVGEMNSRVDIFNAMEKLKGSDYFTDKLLSNVEVQITSPSGEWPDNKILKQSYTPFASRLCQMDIRWKQII